MVLARLVFGKSDLTMALNGALAVWLALKVVVGIRVSEDGEERGTLASGILTPSRSTVS